MPKYSDMKKTILEDGRFLRDSDDELLKRWFFAGVAAAVHIEQRLAMHKANSNAVLVEVDPVKRELDNGVFFIECRCSNIQLKRYHLYCFKCGAKLNWRNFA